MKPTQFLKIGGVPEHFNLPWLQAFQQQKFQKLGIETNWIFFPGGTGAMTQALQTGDLDVAILLTEGFLAAFQKGLKAKIIQRYIETPLQWGIYSKNKKEVAFNEQTKIAISRKGSGSHLMPLIHSQQLGYHLKDEQFIVINHLEEGIRSLESMCDYFYWEKWMTLPFVQQGKANKLGEFHAPWSSFLIVASVSCIERHQEYLIELLWIIQEQVSIFLTSSDTPSLIEKNFQLSTDNAKEWLSEQHWHANENTISKSELNLALQSLTQVGIDMKEIKFSDLYAPWIKLID